MSAQKSNWQDGYVALIDILGFSDGILRDNVQSFFRNYNQSVKAVILKKELKNKLEYIVFSDTIVIYTKDSTWTSFNAIINACSQLYMDLIKIDLPIRGCISYGKFHLNKSENGVILAGRPIIDAYNYEKKQNWIGIIISPSVLDKLSGKKLSNEVVITKCSKIPFQTDDSEIENFYEGYCILPSSKSNPSKKEIASSISKIKDLLEKRKPLAPDVRSQIKYSNTISWLNTYYYEKIGSGGPESPDLYIMIYTNRSKISDDGTWEIPLFVFNNSINPAKNILSFISIENIKNYEKIDFDFCNKSKSYLGKLQYYRDIEDTVLKDTGIILTNIKIKMKKNKKLIKLHIVFSAEKMRKLSYRINLHIYKTKVKNIKTEKEYSD